MAVERCYRQCKRGPQAMCHLKSTSSRRSIDNWGSSSAGVGINLPAIIIIQVSSVSRSAMGPLSQLARSHAGSAHGGRHCKRKLRAVQCRRCQELSNGSMVQGVADLWGRDAAGQDNRLVSPEQLRTQLAMVRLHRSPLAQYGHSTSACYCSITAEPSVV